MRDAGASELIKDDEAIDALPGLVERLISDQETLKKMNQAALKLAKPDAAKQIAKEILTLASSRLN